MANFRNLTVMKGVELAALGVEEMNETELQSIDGGEDKRVWGEGVILLTNA